MTPEELVRDLDQLVALPEICIRVNQMIDSPRYSARDIGDVIIQDADLSARLLRAVNSAMYGLPGPVDTISRAITVIGTRELRDLAIMTSARQLFTGIPADLMNMTEFWHYSISAGVYARVLARKSNILHTERLFIMGVLHDIGRLAILQHMPEAARDILLITEGDDDLLSSAELNVLGFDHAEVGYELLKQWGLPESLQEPVRYHHSPADATEYSLETSLIHIASHLATGEMWGRELDETLLAINPYAYEVCGLDHAAIEGVMDEAADQIVEMTAAILATDTRVSHPAH